LAAQDDEIRRQVASLHEELGRLWTELTQPKKAIENYRRAVEYDPSSQYSVYTLRELYKSAGQWADAIPYFEMEQRLIGEDAERRLALYQDEAEVRRAAGDFSGATQVLRQARALEGGEDAALKQQLASSILERIQQQEQVPEAERSEAVDLFVGLAETYPGEHGYSYSVCALEVAPGHDRAAQLALYYASQLGREAEVAPRAAEYLKANPQGPIAGEARSVLSQAMQSGVVDESLVDALAPPPDADSSAKVSALLEMARAFARKGRKHEAAAKYRDVIGLEVSNEEAISFLEGYLRQTRKYGDLRDLLLSAARDTNAPEDTRKHWLRETAGLCETQLRDLPNAILSWKELVGLDREDDEARAQLSRLLERAGQWDDLATLLEQEAEQTEDVEARLSLEKQVAKIHEQRRKDPVATGATWARIATLTPDDESALTTAVRHFERGERRDLAAQAIAEHVGQVTDERARSALFQKLGQLRETLGEILPAGEAYAEGATLSGAPALWEAAERCFVQAEAWDQAATAADERAQATENPRAQAQLFATEAGYLVKAGDEAGALIRLEQATELDPANDQFASELEQRYQATEKTSELAAFLLKRADHLTDKPLRAQLRKRAAQLQREALQDMEGARMSLVQLLEDGDDAEALTLLADDAEERGDAGSAVEFLRRLARATPDKADKTRVLLKEASLLAGTLDDRDGAIDVYEKLLSEVDPAHTEALERIAELQEQNDNPEGTAGALERLLKLIEEKESKLVLAGRLADIYEGPLDKPKDAVRVLDVVRALNPEDHGALQRLCQLCERLEDWPRVAELMGALISVEASVDEVSRMTRRLSEILNENIGKPDEALAVLMQVGDLGDEASRTEYVRLGDLLGWKGIVATKLVEWYFDAPVADRRNEALRGAFDRFLEVGREADAANVAKELVRTKGADHELATRLEEIAVKLKDLDALGVSHDLLVRDLSGPVRAEEMVRQAEVMVSAGVSPEEAIQHGEQALTSVGPDEVELLLKRLSEISSSPSHIIDLYERQVTRCKNPNDRLRALARAAQVAASHNSLDRARAFFDISLGGGIQDETLSILEEVARGADGTAGGDKLIRTLAEALAAGGQGSRDGGRTRSVLLRRAAQLAFHDMRDVEKAFGWLGDGLVTHVDDPGLDTLEELAGEVGDFKRADAVLSRALEEVFDGPLVRKLLARRAALRRERLDDAKGASVDLKRLHDLSPSDTAVMDQLSDLYTDLQDWRGMVQLYEDQILRGKDQNARAELARKVARLWEERLGDPREAADAWRRVLRMKSGDPEATEGLERSKKNMLKRPETDEESGASPSSPAAEPHAAKPAVQRKPTPAAGIPAQAEKAPSSMRAPLPPPSQPPPTASERLPSQAPASQSGTPASARPRPPPPSPRAGRPAGPPAPSGAEEEEDIVVDDTELLEDESP
jgi:Tfp pilus assembly protein PilF